MAYFSDHPFREDVERYENAYTRWMIVQPGAKRRYKLDDFLLMDGDKGKRMGQEQITNNLKLVKKAITK